MVGLPVEVLEEDIEPVVVLVGLLVSETAGDEVVVLDIIELIEANGDPVLVLDSMGLLVDHAESTGVRVA